MGISNRKPVSVALEYAQVMQSLNRHPAVLQTDREGETTMLGEVYFALAQTSHQVLGCHSAIFIVPARRISV